MILYRKTITNKHLNNNQYYGFREKHSTINVVTASASDVVNAHEKRTKALVFFWI